MTESTTYQRIQENSMSRMIQPRRESFMSTSPMTGNLSAFWMNLEKHTPTHISNINLFSQNLYMSPSFSAENQDRSWLNLLSVGQWVSNFYSAKPIPLVLLNFIILYPVIAINMLKSYCCFIYLQIVKTVHLKLIFINI